MEQFRSNSGLKFLNYRGKAIDNIIIFDPEKQEIVHKEGHGWIEQGYGRDTTVIIFDDCVVKRKLDLSFNGAFCKSCKKDYSRETRYDLYIPTTLCNYKGLGEKVKFTTDTEIYYHNFCTIELTCQLGYEGELKKQSLELSQHSRIEKNDFGAEVEKVEKKLKADGIEIRRYELEKLLQKYKLVKKR